MVNTKNIIDEYEIWRDIILYGNREIGKISYNWSNEKQLFRVTIKNNKNGKERLIIFSAEDCRKTNCTYKGYILEHIKDFFDEKK